MKKHELKFFGEKLKLYGPHMYAGKNVKVLYRSPGWEAEYEDRYVLEYSDIRDTPEGALRILERAIRNIHKTTSKLISKGEK